MVHNENVQHEGNSLLRTAATSKRRGFASMLLGGGNKLPVKKVTINKSDETRVSDITGSMMEEIRPAMIKEVRVLPDIDVGGSIMGMSQISGDSTNFSLSEAFGKEPTAVLGGATRTTPQPASFRPPIRKLVGPVEKKSMEIQPGLKIKAPSPMTLDRVEVQMGQEHTAPESETYKVQKVEQQAQAEEEKAQAEEAKKKELKKQAKYMAMREKAEKKKQALLLEQGEGFETQLEPFDDPDTGNTSPTKKKSLVKRILGKIRPKKAKGEKLSEEEARAIARNAIAKSKGKPAVEKQEEIPLGTNENPFPVLEVATKKDDSVSDLDSSARKGFPIEEFTMGTGKQTRDDESVSTLGTAHVLERMPPGPLTRSAPGDQRDPSPTMENDDMMVWKMMSTEPLSRVQGGKIIHTPISDNALIDRIDSGTMTEDAEAVHGSFVPCAAPSQATKKNDSKASGGSLPKKSGFGLGNLTALCAHPAQGFDTQSQVDDNSDNDQDDDQDDVRISKVPVDPDADDLIEPDSLSEKFSNAIDAAISDAKHQMHHHSIALDASTQSNDGTTADDIRKAIESLDENFEEEEDRETYNRRKPLSPIAESEGPSPQGDRRVFDDYLPDMEELGGINSRNSIPVLEDVGFSGSETMSDIDNGFLRTAEVRHPSKSDVIDLTQLASPKSPSTQDGVKGSTGAFAFDEYMDIAANKLQLKKDDDRYATEGDESPRKKVVVGCHVEGNVGSIPVVQGVEVDDDSVSFNANTPKASGNDHKRGDSTQEEPHLESGQQPDVGKKVAGDSSVHSSFEVFEHPGGKEVVMWDEDKAAGNVPKSETPKEATSKKTGFAGYFPDGLFDLLSTDESVARGRQKVPFLSGKPIASSIAAPSNAQAAVANEINKEQTSQDEPKTLGNDGADPMDPSLGVMCGAVPLYFMYSMQNKKEPDTKEKALIDLPPTPTQKEIEAPSSPASPEVQQSGRSENPIVLDEIEEFAPKQMNSTDEVLLLGTVVRGKDDAILLEKDDAYWDTLSTIASTKDRSSESKVFGEQDFEPRPIPEEITTTNKSSTADTGEKKKVSSPRRSLGASPTRIDDSSEDNSGLLLALSRSDEAEENPTSKASKSPMRNTSKPKRHAVLAMDIDALHQPRTKKHCDLSQTSTPRTQREKRPEPQALTSPKTPTSRMSQPTRSAPSPMTGILSSGGASSEGMSTSCKNSSASCKNSTRSVSWGYEEIFEAPKTADSPRKGSSSIVTEGQDDVAAISAVAAAAAKAALRGAASTRSAESESDDEASAAPQTWQQFSDEMALNALDISHQLLSTLSGQTPSSVASPRRKAPSPESQEAKTPVLLSSDDVKEFVVASVTGDGNKLSDQEEEELISRTLELSKQLLSSMTAQDLEGADDEVLKSLLSFGTEDSNTRGSLPELTDPPESPNAQAIVQPVPSMVEKKPSSQKMSGSASINQKVSKSSSTSVDKSAILAVGLKEVGSLISNRIRALSSKGSSQVSTVGKSAAEKSTTEKPTGSSGSSQATGVSVGSEVSTPSVAERVKALDTFFQGRIKSASSRRSVNENTSVAVHSSSTPSSVTFQEGRGAATSPKSNEATAASTSSKKAETSQPVSAGPHPLSILFTGRVPPKQNHEEPPASKLPVVSEAEAEAEFEDVSRSEEATPQLDTERDATQSRAVLETKAMENTPTAREIIDLSSEGADDSHGLIISKDNDVEMSWLPHSMHSQMLNSGLSSEAAASVRSRHGASTPKKQEEEAAPEINWLPSAADTTMLLSSDTRSRHEDSTPKKQEEEAAPEINWLPSAADTTMLLSSDMSMQSPDSSSLKVTGSFPSKEPIAHSASKSPLSFNWWSGTSGFEVTSSVQAVTDPAVAPQKDSSTREGNESQVLSADSTVVSSRNAASKHFLPVVQSAPSEAVHERRSIPITESNLRSPSSSVGQSTAALSTVDDEDEQKLDKAVERVLSDESVASVKRLASGTSEETPIDVEGLFSRYDDLAFRLVEENAELKYQNKPEPSMTSSPRESTTTVTPSSGPSRLDQLRAARAQAMARYNNTTRPQQQATPSPLSSLTSSGTRAQTTSAAPTTASVATPRTRDRLSQYGRTARPLSAGRFEMRSTAASTLASVIADVRSHSVQRPVQEGNEDMQLETASTNSDSVQTTPSMKARELRRQLDEALQASKNIRESQEQLGQELRSFKDRFYQKNDELEDHAIRAIGGKL
eukprot:Nitzschia sp. Nitz4//scaffold13_size275219//90197//96817//NITZ4_000862-RA/size275219-processed-gene-0.80-mRNA-1//1//CDS//3329535978//7143//frame0